MTAARIAELEARLADEGALAERRIRKLTAERDAARTAIGLPEPAPIDAAARSTFIAGADIPETIERARAALVVRCELAEARLAQVTTALRDIVGLIESGYLVRDTSHDHEPMWVVNQLPAMQKLSRAAMVLKEG